MRWIKVQLAIAPGLSLLGSIKMNQQRELAAISALAASVTFEPGARSNWHTHPAGQTLIVISGRGLYQEKGKPMKTINTGETIICPANIEHWHGASPDSQMNHIAITNDKGAGGVVWLKPVTDEEYNAREQ